MKEYYSSADFIKSPKFDAHIHYHTFDDLFIRKATKANLNLLTINTDFDYLSINKQFEIGQSLHKEYPESFNFLGTFDASAFASKTFAEDSIRQIKKCIEAGAGGIKIWKNMGMALKNEAGQYVMADDPVFDPIFAFLEKEKIPLLAHLGEPRNCWLPVEQMTTIIDREYFNQHPDFHMYLHPEAPSYEQHIMVRDRLSERYPDLVFVGAHLGSMEWSLEEVSKRMERFSNFYTDISVKFEHFFEQVIRNRNDVIDFFQTYQNRILYASDYFVEPVNNRKWMKPFCKYFPKTYMNLLFRNYLHFVEKQWLFFATDEMISTGGMINNESNKKIRGLKLPKKLVDRIFYENARCVYLKQNSND